MRVCKISVSVYWSCSVTIAGHGAALFELVKAGAACFIRI